jgi:hypothetical protein
MEEMFSPLDGISPMWVIVCLEMLVVLGAMSVDFASGFYKAKLRGEERNSYGLKRTVSKFILYVGSLLIACGTDTICYMCGLWKILHVSALTTAPVVTSIVAVFICAIEVRSIWEKAENKQQKEALQTAEAIARLLSKETVGERLTGLLEVMKDKEVQDS